MQLGRIIFKTEFGSKIYGTSLPSSDKDYKGIFIPEAEDILFQTANKTSISISTKINKTDKNTKDDVDCEWFTLQSFIKLCEEGQTVALDMLFAPKECWEIATEEWHFIQKHRDKLIHKNMTAFVGYCRTQAAKYGIKGSRMNALKSTIDYLNTQEDWQILGNTDIQTKLEGLEHISFPFLKGPNGSSALHIEVIGKKIAFHATVKYAKEIYSKIYEKYGHRARLAQANEGIDWKALYHAVRVCHQAKELLTTGHITFPRPEAELLLNIRQGNVDYNYVADLIEEGMKEVAQLEVNSTLPTEIDNPLWNNFIKCIYSETIIIEEKLEKAINFAKDRHKNQVRKYTGEPYFNHLREVAHIVQDIGATIEALQAAYLHDVLEDTDTTIEEIIENFGYTVAFMVQQLTDCNDKSINRAARKAKDRERLSQAYPQVQNIKLADLISNTSSIVKYDPNFAKAYLKEKELLLEVLTNTHSKLYKQAQDSLIQAKLQLLENAD